MKRGLGSGMVRVVTSGRLAYWLGLVWVVYYVTYAIWSGETFSAFVATLRESVPVQALYVLFMASASARVAGAFLVRARRSRLMSVMWLVLPLGVMVFLLGFFVSAVFRQQGLMVAGQGDTVRPEWQDEAYTVSSIEPFLKDRVLDIDTDSGIFQYEPKVVIETDNGVFRAGVFPPRYVDGTYYHILQFGMAPGIRFSDADGILREGYMIQKILPPGVMDEFTLPPYPYKFSIRLAPEGVYIKGGTKARVFNMKDPSYFVVVRRGEDEVFEGSSGQGVAFEGFTLELEPPEYWVLLEAAWNPGLLIIVAGIALMAVGIPTMTVLALAGLAGRDKTEGHGPEE